MSEQMNKVILVLDPDYGDNLASLAALGHVWVIDTPANLAAASEYWAQNQKHEVKTGITTFKSSENESRLESCLNILETIDLHHGKYSSHLPYSVLEIIGLRLTDEVKSAIKALGFGTFESTVEGFRAMR
jgi:hypothetical protein